MRRSTVGVALASALGLGLAVVLWAWLGGVLLGPWATAWFTAQAQGARIYRVAPSCSGIPNCYTRVQDAVNVALDGDVIQVAGGVYTDAHTAVVESQKTITQVVYVGRSVTIQGGYTTTNWQTPDPLANPTVLDARGQGRVLYIPRFVSATVEGFSITGGDARGLGGEPTTEEDVGGGVYVAGGGGLVFRHNRVFGNDGRRYGGGLYLADAVATLRDNTITSNTAYQGGGLYLFGGAALVEGNTVSANDAAYGGGLFLSSSAATVSGNTISANRAITAGGGLLVLHSSGAVLNGNVVVANRADEGGGVYLGASAATLANTIIADNQVTTRGSGVAIGGSSPTLLHTTIVRNRGGDGSGIYVTSGITGSVSYTAVVALANTILVSHTVGIHVTAGNTGMLEATLWGAGTWANTSDSAGAGTIITGALNVRGDPDFVAPGAGDYHIGIASAAIDQGVGVGVQDDVDGEPRPQGRGYDLGADETGLALIKEANPALVAPGARLHYTIRVTNTSIVPLTVAMTDVLPAHVTPTGLLVWAPAVLPPGGVQIRTVVVTVEAGYAGPLTNVVEAATDAGASGVYVEVSSSGYRIYLPLVVRDGRSV